MKKVKRTAFVIIRTTEDEKKSLIIRAKESKQKLSEFVRGLLGL